MLIKSLKNENVSRVRFHEIVQLLVYNNFKEVSQYNEFIIFSSECSIHITQAVKLVVAHFVKYFIVLYCTLYRVKFRMLSFQSPCILSCIFYLNNYLSFPICASEFLSNYSKTIVCFDVSCLEELINFINRELVLLLGRIFEKVSMVNAFGMNK